MKKLLLNKLSFWFIILLAVGMLGNSIARWYFDIIIYEKIPPLANLQILLSNSHYLIQLGLVVFGFLFILFMLKGFSAHLNILIKKMNDFAKKIEE